MRHAPVFLAALALACIPDADKGSVSTPVETDPDGPGPSSPSDTDPSTPIDAPDTAPSDPGGDTDPGEPSNLWRTTNHGCIGNNVDALHFDDAMTGWLGCGSSADGEGFYGTTDGGATWGPVTSDTRNLLAPFRVSSIQRADDGWLYIGGIRVGSEHRVIRLDTRVTPYVAEDVLLSESLTWNNFHVGTFRRAADGTAVSESLTGADLAYRQSDSDPFVNGEGWPSDAGGYQLLDLEVHNGVFYGGGSTISQPPMFFQQEPRTDGQFVMTPIPLSDGSAAFAGTIWDVVVDDDGIIAVGEDNDLYAGIVFTGTLPVTDASSFEMFDVRTLLTGYTRLRGACRGGGILYVVGDFSTRDDGIVLRSDDGGATFTDITPDNDPPALWKCAALDDGTVAVAGGRGYLAMRAP